MIEFHVIPDLLYVIPADNHSAQDLRNILTSHPEIKFVSLAAVDLMGNQFYMATFETEEEMHQFYKTVMEMK